MGSAEQGGLHRRGTVRRALEAGEPSPTAQQHERREPPQSNGAILDTALILIETAMGSAARVR